MSSSKALQDQVEWMRRQARRLIGNQDLADDIVQDAWLRLSDGSEAMSGGSSRYRLFGVLARIASHRRRGARRRENHERSCGRERMTLDASTVLERREVLDALTHELQVLPEPIKTTLIERVLRGTETRVLARRQGVSEETVRWRVRRGLQSLRSRLERRFGRDVVWALPLFKPPQSSLSSRKVHTPVKNLVAAAAICLLLIPIAWKTSLDRVSPSDKRMGSGPPRQTPVTSRSESIATIGDAHRVLAHPQGSERGQGVQQVHGVVYGDGAPLAGATVYAVAIAEQESEEPIPPLAVTTTDDEGSFRLDLVKMNGRVDIGAFLNGYVRQLHKDVDVRGSEPPVSFELDRGMTLGGVVCDGEGRPLEGVEIFAAPRHAALEDDAISSNLLLASALRFADRHSTYEDSWTVSAEDGSFELRGLIDGLYTLRGTSGRYKLATESHGAGRHDVRITATPSLALNLALHDQETGLPVPCAEVRVSVRVRREDGSHSPHTGECYAEAYKGNIVLNLSPYVRDALLGHAERGTAHWKGLVIAKGYEPRELECDVGVSGDSGFHHQRIDLTPQRRTRASLPVILDVRYDDGTPCRSGIELHWVGSRGNRLRLTLPPDNSGIYQCELPRGNGRLQVNAGDSLAPYPPLVPRFEMEIDLQDPEGERHAVALPRNGEVTIFPHPEALERREWRLTLRHEETHLQWDCASQRDTIRVSGLPPGLWSLEVALPGGQDSRRTQILMGQSDRIDVRFQ